MSDEAEQYKNDMFKIYEGEHPLGEKSTQVPESRVAASGASRYGANWSREELLAVILAQPPQTLDSIALELRREHGSIDAIRTYTKKALLHPEQFMGENGYRNPQYGVYWRIVDLLEEEGIQEWDLAAKQQIVTSLDGTKNRKAKDARYRARNT